MKQLKIKHKNSFFDELEDYNDYCVHDWDGDDYYYDSYGWCKEIPSDHYSFTYIPSINKFTMDTDGLREFGNEIDSYDVYIENNQVYYETYTYHSTNKLEAFFGCVMKVVLFSETKPYKIKNIYNILCERYPEIHFRLMDKFPT